MHDPIQVVRLWDLSLEELVELCRRDDLTSDTRRTIKDHMFMRIYGGRERASDLLGLTTLTGRTVTSEPDIQQVKRSNG